MSVIVANAGVKTWLQIEKSKPPIDIDLAALYGSFHLDLKIYIKEAFQTCPFHCRITP